VGQDPCPELVETIDISGWLVAAPVAFAPPAFRAANSLIDVLACKTGGGSLPGVDDVVTWD
jgi:hypothetical protein